MEGALILAGIGLAAAAGYVLECWVWPFKRCRRCEGTGKHRAWWGVKAWRRCRRCRGTGERVRGGRRAWNYYARLRRESR